VSNNLIINKTELGTSGKYVFGDEITAADVFFYPQVLATKSRWNVDLSPLPSCYKNLGRIYKKLNSLQMLNPENQPDRD
jgi:glutathione S-transferase